MSKQDIKAKALKITPVTAMLIDVFEIIYTEQGKGKAFQYGVDDSSLFQYQKKKDYYAKITSDLIKHGVPSLDNLKKLVSDFDERISVKPNRTKTIELQSNLTEEVNAYIKANSLTGQEFILQALERTIIRNDIDINYLINIVNKIESKN